MRITILYGGKSGEHEVSLVSAASIVRTIDNTENTINLIGIDKDGKWYYQDSSEYNRIKTDSSLPLQIQKKFPVSIVPGGGINKAIQVFSNNTLVDLPTDVVFPVLHGTYGEDGTVQGLLEMAELPYVGCGTMASALTMDKEKTKQVWLDIGLPIVPFVCIRRAQKNDKVKFEKALLDCENKFTYPIFIKPCCAGSSVGASKATNREEFINAINEALLWDEKILVEPFLPAREIECSVTGNDKPIAYIPGEIAPTHEFYDYDAKYTDPDGAALLIPANIDKNLTEKVRDIAVKAFSSLDCTGLSRVDFFLNKETNELLLNEINTMPGFTSISMFSKMCDQTGVSYKKLIEELIFLGIERFNARRNLKTSR